MREVLLPRSTANKEILIDWLTDVPDDAEIGIDVGQFGQLDLLAVRQDGDMWILALDSIPYPADKAEADVIRAEMMDRLREIHAEAGETEKGVLIVTIEGVVSGAPDLFSMSVDEAFTFKDRTQARDFIDEFFDVLKHATILAC